MVYFFLYFAIKFEMMKRTSLICTFFILSFANSQAQYHLGFGVRFGKLNNGVTFKEFFQADQTIGMELQLNSSLIAATYGYSLKGFLLDQIGFRIPYIQLPLDFVFGGGLQFGYYPYNPPDNGYYKIESGEPVYYRKNVFTAGVAANIGLEYELRKTIPLTIGIDAIPAYDFLNPGPDWFDFGVNIRYVIR